jgi:hypothetical protein
LKAVGRNIPRVPAQSNSHFSVAKRFPLPESKSLDFRADFFNLFNHASRDNPNRDISMSDLGKILSFGSSPRTIRLSLKLHF